MTLNFKKKLRKSLKALDVEVPDAAAATVGVVVVAGEIAASS